MTLRSDTNAGLITCGLGVAMVSFGAFGLSIVGLQHFAITTFSTPSARPGVAFMSMMDGMHWILLRFLPLMMVGGVVFAICGFYIRQGSLLARRIAQFNAICGYAWGAGYALSCWNVGSQLAPPPGIPPGVHWVSQIVSGIGGGVMLVAIPTGLLFLLQRPKIQP